MIFVVATLVGIAFGAADQYLGSLRSLVALGPWAVAVSGMSAPWLLLPFAFGYTQERPRRAVLVGSVAVASALAGYFAMTVSPIEGVALKDLPQATAALLASNGLVIVGGVVTAPVFALLGQRWRVDRWWVAAAIVAGVFVFEPLALLATGRLTGPAWIWLVEAAVGGCLAVGFAVTGNPSRRRSAA